MGKLTPRTARPTHTGGRPTGRAVPCPCCLLAVSVLGLLLASAPATQLAPQTPQTPPPAKADAAAPTAKETAPPAIIPSRLVGENELDAYLESLSSTFSMRNRATDPFGQLQDPNAKPVVKPTTTKVAHRVVQVQATPFSEIVRLIKVTAIMPKDQCFLMGSRTVKLGERLNLAYRGKTLRVEVATVNSRQIDFLNLDNNETASVKLNMLPAGMSRGTASITAPGMAPDRPDAPIELDPANTPNDKNPSR